jgi:hypothetical protein
MGRALSFAHAVFISGIRELQANDADGPPTTKYRLPQAIHKFNLASQTTRTPNVPDFSLLKLELESVLRSTEPKIHSYNNPRNLPRLFMLPPLNRERYPNTFTLHQ